MTHSRRSIILAALMLLHGVAATQAITFDDLLLRIQTEPPHLLLHHCAVAAPETQEELVAAYDFYKVKFADAAASFAKDVPTGALEGDSELADRFISELGAATLNAVKGLEPHAYCSWLVTSLRSSTTEKLKSTMRIAYDRYAELVRSRAKPPVSR